MATLPFQETLVNDATARPSSSVPAAGTADPSRLERLRRYMQEDGVVAAGHRLLRSLIGPIYHSACFWFLVCRTDQPMQKIRPLTPCTIRQATRDDLDLLATVGFQTRAQLAAQLRSTTELCFFAHRGGRVLAFQWVVLGERDLRILPLHRSLHLHKDEAYLHTCRTIRAYRAQGIIPVIEHMVWKTLRDRGIRVIATDIASTNRPSLSTMEKIGYTRVERMTVRRILGVSSLRAHQLRLCSRRPVGVLLVKHPAVQDSEVTRALAHIHPASATVVPGMPRAPRGAQPASRPGRWPLPSFRHASRLFFAARSAEREIVHARGIESLGSAWLLSRLGGIRHLTLDVTHDELEQPSRVPIFERLRVALIRWLVRRCETVFVTSEAARDVCVRQGWASDSQVQILMKSAMPTPLGGDGSVASSRLRLGLRPEDPIVAACLEDLESDGRVWRLLELCKDLDAIAPRCQVLLFGAGRTARMVRRQIEEDGMAQRVVLHGQEDSQAALEAADLFLDLSDDPNGSLTALQATALSRPVMTFSALSQASAAGQESGGASLESSSLTSAEELVRILQATADLQKMAEAARARLTPEFVWRALAIQISQAWRSLVAADVFESTTEHWRAGHGCAAFSRHAG